MAPRPTDRSSAKPPHSPTRTEQFALGGPSTRLDPRTHAYRDDLADIDLAGQVIASHYARPVDRVVAATCNLYCAAAADSEILATLNSDDRFELLDDSLGWAWGYAGPDRRVGYVRSEALIG